jgi:hypothetical protein
MRIETIVGACASLILLAVLLPLGEHLKHSHPVVAFLIAFGLPGLCFGFVLADLFLFRLYACIQQRKQEKARSRAHASRPGLTGAGHL